MRFVKIQISNFLSYGENQEIDLYKKGLVGVFGHNKDSAYDSNGSGKCLPSSSVVYSKKLGKTTIGEVVSCKDDCVLGYKDGKISYVPVIDWIKCGYKDLVIVSSHGWELKTATTHPILTNNGWKQAKSLSTDDYIACPRRLPYFKDSFSSYEALLAGLMIGDGTMTDNGCVLCSTDPYKVSLFKKAMLGAFFKPKVVVTNEYTSIVKNYNKEVNLKFLEKLNSNGVNLSKFIGKNFNRFRNGKQGLSLSIFLKINEICDVSEFGPALVGNPYLLHWCRKAGIAETSSNKTLGKFADGSEKITASLLLGLWATDGYVSKERTEVSYSTASKVLSEEVRDALLKLGIASTRHTKNVHGVLYYNVTVLSSGFENFKRIELGGEKGNRFFNCAHKKQNVNLDSIPFNIWYPKLKDRVKKSSISAWVSKSRGMSREKFAAFGGDLSTIPDVTWKKVDSVRYCTEKEECFDIEVDTAEHAYVADGVVVHNSALMESIVWCIWGTTIRGLKSDDVVNNKANQGCKVSLFIEDKDTLYTITRTRKNVGEKKQNDLLLFANSDNVTAGTVSATQNLVNNIIGMSLNTFSQSVLLTNSYDTFCTLSDDKKKEILEDILQINIFRKSRAIVREKIVKQEKNLAVAMSRLVDLKESSSEVAIALKENEVKMDNFKKSFDVNKEQVIKQLREKEADLAQRMEKHKELRAAKAELDKVEQEISVITTELNKFKKQEEDIRQETQDGREIVLSKLAVLDANIKTLKNEHKQMSSLAGTSCPTCRQDVNPSMADDFMEQCELNINKRKEEKEKLNKILAGVMKKDEETKININKEKDKVMKKAENLINLRKEREEAVNNLMFIASPNILNMLDQSISELNGRLESMDGMSNPFTDIVANLRKEKDKTERSIRYTKVKIKAIEETVKKLRFWDLGFSNTGIKSLVMENVVPFLNNKAQTYADILSDGKLNVTFSTKTSKKNGNIVDNFDVKVTNASGADVYTGNSSGERRRGDIAVGWALADLAATRANKPVRFRGLDEPFESLDESGIDSVFSLLNNVVSNYETIFVISHNSALRDRFNNELKVVKENGISRISDMS